MSRIGNLSQPADVRSRMLDCQSLWQGGMHIGVETTCLQNARGYGRSRDGI